MSTELSIQEWDTLADYQLGQIKALSARLNHEVMGGGIHHLRTGKLGNLRAEVDRISRCLDKIEGYILAAGFGRPA